MADLYAINSRQLLKQLFGKNPLPIAVQNLAGRYTYVNAAYERLFGYKEADLIDQSFIEVVVPREFQKGVREEFLRLIALGEPPSPATHIHVTSDGEERLIRYNFDHIRAEGGTPMATLVIAHDITEDLPDEPTEGGLLPQFVTDELSAMKPMISLLQVNVRQMYRDSGDASQRLQLDAINHGVEEMSRRIAAIELRLRDLE